MGRRSGARSGRGSSVKYGSMVMVDGLLLPGAQPRARGRGPERPRDLRNTILSGFLEPLNDVISIFAACVLKVFAMYVVGGLRKLAA